MKCEICGIGEVAINVSQVIGSEVMELNLCEQCAFEQGFSDNEDHVQLSFPKLLSDFVELSRLDSGKNSKSVCPVCGLEFKDFQDEGRLGCEQCFSTFKTELKMFLENIPGASFHKGRYPKRLLEQRRILADRQRLETELKTAVKREDYEQAAEIRDCLNGLESRLGDGDGQG